MNDLAQTKLREPEQVDWDNYNSGGGTYTPPPPALDAAGRSITYYGKITAAEKRANAYQVDDEGNAYLNFALDGLKITGPTNAGYELRFTEASTKPFTKPDGSGGRAPIKGNPNALANYLRACGLQAKPQTNDQYEAAVRAAAPKTFGFTLDWFAKSKDTGEQIKGYASFPDDPERPGRRSRFCGGGICIMSSAPRVRFSRSRRSRARSSSPTLA